MRWSYSRASSFDECPHKWFLKYIKEYKEIPQFYSSYGKFIHKLIEKYYLGELKNDELVTEFLLNFKQEVKGFRPKDSIVKKYIEAGIKYFNCFKPFPYETVAVEKEIKFEIRGIEFIGFIDYIGKSQDGDLIIIDNKSRNLTQRSRRNKPTKKDIELDDMLRQLYVYSAAIKKEYGVYPKLLCFNCFKNGEFIKEEFNMQKYLETEEWVVNKIRSIEDADGFPANPEYFRCNFLCGVNDCCEYKE